MSENDIKKPMALDLRDIPLAQFASEPQDVQDLVFAEPWHAQVYAMAVCLHEKGYFAWSEWSQTLGQQIKAAQNAGDPDLGDSYYQHWLGALEQLLVGKGLASQQELAELQTRWHAAAMSTPHGEPISID